MAANSNFLDFAEDSDIHGVKQVTRKENGWVRRTCWVLLILGSLTVLIYNTTQQVIEFFEYHHLTKYDVNFVSELNFPAVTICNVNKHRRTALTDLDIALMGPHLGFADENMTLLHPELYPSDWASAVMAINYTAVLEANSGNDYDLTDFYNRTGHQFSDFVQHCQWKGQLCSESSWVMQYTHYGRCYTFNEQGDHNLRKAGSGNGLQLVLNVEEAEYLETDDAGDLGIKFLTHNTVEPPFLKELGSGLSPGYHYFVSLQQREIVTLPAPHGQCAKDYAMTYYTNYTVPGCRIECETQAIQNACGCRLVESPGTHPVCTVNEYDCAEQTLLDIEQSDNCLCRNPCHAIEYPFSLSWLQLRSNTINKLKKEHPIPANLTESQIVVLNIYFDVLANEYVEQRPAYTVLSILSDFGGTMGLWLGASVLAAAQLIDYLIMRCVGCCKAKRVKDNNQVPTMKNSAFINDATA